jgi:tetratricopeptide (TPR) repeat protein
MTTAAEYYSRATNVRLAGDLDGAVVNYRQALALVPDNATTWNQLGTALQWLGRFAEAADCFRRALAIKPDLVEAYRCLSFGQQLAADGAEFGVVAALAAAADLPIEDRCTAAFTLAKTLDDAGRFDEAFAAYEHANAMYRAAQAAAGEWFDATALRRQVDEAIAAFTPKFFAMVNGWGVPSEIPVFIVGMPRSGTSLVEQIAASHSGVFGAGELLDISRLANESGPGIGESGLRWEQDNIGRAADLHLARLREIGGSATRVIDKLPDNVFHLGLIGTLFPRARIIFCRRELRDTAISCYFQKFAPGMMVFSYDLADCGRRFLQVDRLIAHWQRVLPLPMLEIEYERLVSDLPGEALRLVSFLGLEWEPACLEFHRTGRTVRTSSAWQVRQPLYDRSLGRWRNYERQLAPLLEAVSADDDTGAEPNEMDHKAREIHDEVAAHFEAAAEAYRANDLDGAEVLYRAVLERLPRHAEALHWLGMIAGDRGEYAEAARLIGEAVSIAPYHPEAHCHLGYALQQLTRIGEAETSFRNALALLPDFPPALGNLGRILMAAGRGEEALGYLRKLATLQPDDADCQFDLATGLRQTGDIPGSLEALRRVVSLAPEFQSGWNDLGLTYVMLKNWSDAEACFRRVLEIEPGSNRALQQLAYVEKQKSRRAPV